MKNSHRQLSQSHSFYFHGNTFQHIPAQSLILPHAFGPNIAHKFNSGSTPECVAEADLGGGGGGGGGGGSHTPLTCPFVYNTIGDRLASHPHASV